VVPNSATLSESNDQHAVRRDTRGHGRRSIRLHGYDYTQPGAYFVTVCTHDRACLFDHPVVRAVVDASWRAIPRHFPQVTLDAYVIMPNHLHGILIMNEASCADDTCVGGHGGGPGGGGRGKAFACGPGVYEDMANGLEHWMTAVSVRMPYPYNAYVPNAPVSLPRCTGPCTAARYAHTRHGPRLSAK